MPSSWLVLARITSLLILTAAFLRTAVAQEAARKVDGQLYTGQWKMVGPMHERREYAGGIPLKDGRVLAVSGHPLEGKSIASAELYEPATGRWSETGSLRQPRNGGNGATLLEDGRVLLAGGHTNSMVIKGAEIFDPTKGAWSDAGHLSVARDPMPTLLADGRVLFCGGIDWHTNDGTASAVAEIFDPMTGEWTVTGSLAGPRYEHRTILLDGGRVLAMGGYAQGEGLLATTEVYDPASGRWQAANPMPEPRAWFGHVKLNDGRVLVVGGYTGSRSKRTYLSSAAFYDSKSGRWKATAPMQSRRAGFSTTLLPDGQVLVAGGVAESGAELKSAELFDPPTETWRAAAPMNVHRRNHRAALLPDGSVLVIGGSSLAGGRTLTSCEVFSP